MNWYNINSKLFVASVLLVSFIIFFMAFQNNRFNTADPLKFETFAMGTESFVINRIAVSEKLSPQAFGGFTGRIPQMDNTATAKLRVRRGRSVLDQYYNIFYNKLTEDNFKPYLSNPALQSRLLAFLNSRQLARGENFSNYRAIFSAISALVFSFLIVFLLIEFGLIEATMTLLVILQLDWIIASASHLFWFSGLMFAPFVFNLFAFQSKKIFTRKYLALVLVINAVLCMLKCLTSGFEVIPSFLVMSCLPPFYYFLVKSWKFKYFALLFALLSISSLSGLAVAMSVHAQQIDVLKNEDGAGKKHLMSSFTRRSSGKNRVRLNMPSRIKESYSVSALDVIKKYDSEPVVSLNNWPRPAIPVVSSNHLIYMLLGLSIFWIISFLTRSCRTPNEVSKIKGLVFMSWVSILSPISMFVSFKSLSWLHPHLVPITWNMPFSILVFLLLIFTMRILASSFYSNFAPKKFQHIFRS